MLNTNSIIANSGIAFGTSGARGLVADFTAEVCMAFTHAFTAVMRRSFEFEKIGIAIDRRPSSYNIAMQCVAALRQLGIEAIYYGVLPTPALAYSTIQLEIPAIMVTGSHIPFNRNGLKFYRPDGEIDKKDELQILISNAMFESVKRIPEMAIDTSAASAYIERYRAIVKSNALEGKHIGIYEHSSAGRDIYATLFKRLGAKVTSLGRSDEFIPIDTEAVSKEDHLKAKLWSKEYHLDAIFSTDGDGDRPLLADENGDWLRGDILGLLCAKLLNIEALSVPINCNTAIERSGYFRSVNRTKIGSPYVIAEFPTLNKKNSAVAGFEANGGFILASDLAMNEKELKALPTRDALLPAIILLTSQPDLPISELTRTIPKRFTASDRITQFPNFMSKQLITECAENTTSVLHELGIDEEYISTDQTDGFRIYLNNGDIVHFRPSGNAPELRIYSESDSDSKAISLVEMIIKNASKIC